VKLELFRLASFASRILWPPQLRGQPLFEYQPEPNPPMWRRLTGSGRIESTLSSMVSAFLASGDPQSKHKTSDQSE